MRGRSRRHLLLALVGESRGCVGCSEAERQNDSRKGDDPAVDLRHDDLSLGASFADY